MKWEKLVVKKNERAAAAAFPAKEREKQQKMNERIVRRMAFIFGIVSRRQAQNGPNKAIVCVAHYFRCGFRSGTFRVYIFFYFSFRYLFASDYRPNWVQILMGLMCHLVFFHRFLSTWFGSHWTIEKTWNAIDGTPLESLSTILMVVQQSPFFSKYVLCGPHYNRNNQQNH